MRETVLLLFPLWEFTGFCERRLGFGCKVCRGTVHLVGCGGQGNYFFFGFACGEDVVPMSSRRVRLLLWLRSRGHHAAKAEVVGAGFDLTFATRAHHIA